MRKNDQNGSSAGPCCLVISQMLIFFKPSVPRKKQHTLGMDAPLCPIYEGYRYSFRIVSASLRELALKIFRCNS